MNDLIPIPRTTDLPVMVRGTPEASATPIPVGSDLRPQHPTPQGFTWKRLFSRNVIGLFCAFALAALFFVWTQSYFEPLHGGVDQNGYLVGGKQFSRTLSPRQTPTVPGRPEQFDPHAFVADMWVQAANDKGAFDPKYPIGLPLLYALTIWATAGGTLVAYYVSPIAMALAVAATFVVARRFSNNYGGLLAAITFAVSPMIAALTNNPNSHAVTICSATWGIAAVLHWWHGGRRAFAVVGGLLVGYAATVRYTEGLLVLPLLWAAVVPVASRRDLPSRRPLRERLLGGVVLMGAWAVPVASLAAYNLYFLGTLTGYDSTNESTGFAWSYFFDNWETLLRNLSGLGLLLVMPLAAIGLLWLPFRDWRRGVFLVLWAGPITALYIFYYWGPDGVSYLRFFSTVLPAYLCAAASLLVSRDARHVLPNRYRGSDHMDATAGAMDSSQSMRMTGAESTAPAVASGVVSTREASSPPTTDRVDPEIARGVVRAVGGGTAALLVAAAVGIAVFYSVRVDPTAKPKRLLTLAEFVAKAPTAYQRLGGAASVVGGCVAAAAVAGAIAATRRRSAVALAGGVVTLLSAAVAADASAVWFEGNAYTTRTLRLSIEAIKQSVPDGAVLFARENELLQALQFQTDDRLYNGLTFDRGYVNSRPQSAEDPVLVDPGRGRQLIEALRDAKGKDLDQNALNEQARAKVRDAINGRRRVFVVEAVGVDPGPPDAMLRTIRKKVDGQVPEFVRRFVVRPKDTSLTGRRVTWWTVPQVVKDDWPYVPRGRRNARPDFRPRCYQLWEIVLGPATPPAPPSAVPAARPAAANPPAAKPAVKSAALPAPKPPAPAVPAPAKPAASPPAKPVVPPAAKVVPTARPATRPATLPALPAATRPTTKPATTRPATRPAIPTVPPPAGPPVAG